MLRILRSCCSALCLGALVLSCGGGDEALTVDRFCSEKAARECGATGSGGVADRCVVKVTEECKPARTAVCTAWVNGIQQQSGSTRPYNAGRTQECLDKTSEVYKKAAIAPADLEALQVVCDRVFSGSKKKGDPCGSDFECGGSLVCDGVCADRTTLAAGDFCEALPGAVCGPGLFCTTPAGQPRKMCVPRPNTGEACDDSKPCLETLRCLASSSTCEARLPISETCTSNADCASTAPYCDPYAGMRCDTGFIPSLGTPECTTFGAPAR